MLEVGEDRAAERVEERGKSGGSNEVLGKCTAHPSTLSIDEATRALRVEESLHPVVVGLQFPAS